MKHSFSVAFYSSLLPSLCCNVTSTSLVEARAILFLILFLCRLP